VLLHRREADRIQPAELADAALTIESPRHDAAPCRIAEREEQPVSLFLVLQSIYNHLVVDYTSRRRCQSGSAGEVVPGGEAQGSVTTSDRVLAVVAAAPDDAKVGTPFGEQTLDTYLRSRAAELLLQGVDLGTDVAAPPDVLVECGSFLVERAVRSGRGVEVLRAVSGRGTLSPGFNVY